MLVVEKLKNLNNIHRDNRLGIYKRWFYNSTNDYHRICDYMQKINYSIQDLNSQIDELTEIQMKDVVFIIVLVDWIINSCNEIEKLINKQVLRKFSFNKENQLKSAKDYLKALRSFIVAHPLNTTRHDKFGFNGNFICVDIRVNKSPAYLLLPEKEFYYIDYKGIHNKKSDASDFFLMSYSEEDGMQFSKFIGCKFEDIYNVAKLYIERLYALDKYLSKQKKKSI